MLESTKLRSPNNIALATAPRSGCPTNSESRRASRCEIVGGGRSTNCSNSPLRSEPNTSIFSRAKKSLHIERARIQIIPRRPRLHLNLHAIPSPQSRRRFRNPRLRIKIHAQSAGSVQRRARRLHLFQINLEALPPRECQRILAQIAHASAARCLYPLVPQQSVARCDSREPSRVRR